MTRILTIAIKCPLCNSDKHSPHTKTRDYLYRIEGEFCFVRCSRCDHLYMNPRPADESILDCYPDDYVPHLVSTENEAANNPSATRQVMATQAGEPKKGSLLRRVLRKTPFLRRFLFWLGQQNVTVVPPVPSDRTGELLEIGCAHGAYLQQASEAGWIVDGIEPGAGAAEEARNRRFRVQTSMLSDAQWEPNSRDAVIAWMVLEHVPNPVRFLETARDILRNDGWLCLSVPNAGGFERRLFGPHWLGYDAPRHLQIFTAKRLRRLLFELGYVDVCITHQSSIRYWWGSIAAWGNNRFPNAAWPVLWLGYFLTGLPKWMSVVSLAPEKTLSMLHLSGRITVTARKPKH